MSGVAYPQSVFGHRQGHNTSQEPFMVSGKHHAAATVSIAYACAYDGVIFIILILYKTKFDRSSKPYLYIMCACLGNILGNKQGIHKYFTFFCDCRYLYCS